MKGNRIDSEKNTVKTMIELYCKKKEGNQSLCKDCQELLNYAYERLDKCPFGENKTYCKKCKIHCYKPDMRERMRKVMRFSGPRMIIYSPLAAIKHLLGK